MSQADAFGPAPRKSGQRLTHDAWARFVARTADVLVLVLPGTFALGLIVGLIGLAWPPLMSLVVGGGVAGFAFGVAIALLASLILESLCLSVFGATPGKWLMGVRVRDAKGAKLSLGAALKRWFYVFAMGRGLDIPLIGLITAWFSFQQYESEGVTAYDKQLSISVDRPQIAQWRWVLGIALVAGCYIVNVAFKFVQMAKQQGL
ncbi:MAG TPA: RDD family protein [Caulobacteraceae bacterium]|jgi:uncharacterized RDD family membrane protein YckC|nr:RDD family protein [Caulobacteraceae bacterium]